ncbi:hypothetical protein QP794_24150 [Paenibacillus sp. UMB7766-LJ446]|uniref:hypothetical protein n=1 Tax=Paenibacillus sp. UMB7766-LJ446 TaxID=3046313 RepID=UPI0025508AAB|nr:hypothetical protein [Paenibacillus sp. UMB7766-LJ446]MDK8193184.1 hypothetical protein [Paenibacillus sp. UMB7766-LJ446]
MNHYGYYVERILAHWIGEPKEGAYKTIRKYGLPNVATLSELKWYNNRAWKRILVFREPVQHNFPTPHVDFMEQIVDNRVPVDMFDEIAKFDGSAYLDRTQGKATAKCHTEEMNFLTLNLLHDIVTGKRDVKNARMFYADIAALLYPTQTNTSDPDMAFFNTMD